MSSICPTFDDLISARPAKLKALYAEILGHPPPLHASRAFLQGNIAWALQAQNSGYAPATLTDELLASLKPPQPTRRRPLKTGTRLIREWQGTVHEVTVTDGGYSWDGRLYTNLSRIATEITGVKWSGPRFFGLKR